ncbi:MAG: PQQ-like beta-propeller repeat protein, partial [Akkermansiaceae bacterium]|nr:PQQ-like beta-propeller repeat protein [Akkermansiaceae bacterium]
PVAWRDRVLFGSDDGNFYCLAAGTGEPLWKFKAVPSDRRLIGNERLISVWPIRGGPVLKDGRVYFAAGVWPFEGVFIYCLDAATGKRIWLNDSTGHLYGQQPHNAVAIGGIAPQGYLLIDGDDLVVPSSNAYPGRFDLKTGALKDFKLPLGGRAPGGWYASLPGKAEQRKTKRKSLLADLGINVMRHEDRLRFEGTPGVRTTIRAGEQELKFANGLEGVPGKIHSMIAADGRLFVTTAAGGLYAFGEPGRTRPPLRPAGEGPGRARPPGPATALVASAPRHGYAVFLGAPDAATLHQLVAGTELHLIVVDSDPTRGADLRRQFVRSGAYGSRIAVILDDPATFEMPPY